MKTWIALLRGVNVGGKNKLPMIVLASELEKIGLSGIKTYIQSGNVVFRSPPAEPSALAARISDTIMKSFSFRPHVVVTDAAELADAVLKNPFPDVSAEADGKALHLFFLDSVPDDIDRAGLEAVKQPSEAWATEGKFFYLYTPAGFHTSKLAAKAEKLLGVPATARNWRSVTKILALAAAIS